MKKRLLAGFMACALVLSLLPTAAFAADGDVSYRTCDPDGTNWQTGTKASGEYTAVTADDTEWTSGWYVASGGVTIDRRVTVTGDVHLILEDNCNLTVNGGIGVNEGNSITIYAQSEGGSMGELTANGTNGAYNIGASAGIGGDGGIYVQGKTAGTITIYGGRVTANGGNGNPDDSGQAAGIGGGGGGHFDHLTTGGAGGTVNIYGGYVKTTGGKNPFDSSHACGIGGGYNSYANNDANGGTINITGGTLSDTTTSTSGTFNMTGGTLDNCKIQNATAATSGNSVAIKNSTVNGTVTVSDNAEFEGTLTFNGAVSVNNASFTGSIKFVSGATITGNATVNGSTELTGDMAIIAGGTLTNSSTLTVPTGSTITNHGTITNGTGATINLSGTIDDTAAPNGTVTNNGTIFLISDGTILDSSAITPNAPVSSGSSPVPAGEIVIDLSTVKNAVTIGPKEYTIDGTSHAYDPAQSVIVLTGTYGGNVSSIDYNPTAAVMVLENTTASITLRNVNIGWEKDNTSQCSSIWAKDNCAVTVFLEGNNTLKPKHYGCGIRTEERSSLTVEGTGTLNLDLSNSSTIVGIGQCGSSSTTGKFGSITINGGNIVTTVGTSHEWVAGIGGTHGTITVNGGTITGNKLISGSNSTPGTDYEVVINGGTINIVDNTTDTSYDASGDIGRGSLTINGGVVSMPKLVTYGSDGSITINGGQVTTTHSKGYLSYTAVINGGTVTGKISVNGNNKVKINGGSAKLTQYVYNSEGGTIESVTTSDGKTAYRTVLTGQTSVASVLVDGKSQNISYNHPDDPAGTADNNLYLYLVHDENATAPETHEVIVMDTSGNRKEYTATWNTDKFEFGTGTDSNPTDQSSIDMTMTGTTTGTDGKPEKTYGDAAPVVVTVNLNTTTKNSTPPPASNGPMLAAENSLPYAFRTVILLCTDKNNVTREIERKDVPENQTSVVFYVQTQAWAPGEYKFTATYGGDASTGSSAIAETSAPALNIVGQKLDKNALTVNVAVSGTYGQKVSDLTVSGTVTQSGLEIPGTWAVSGVNGDTVLDVGTAQALTATFTPSGKGYDDTLTRTVTPTINKATPTVTAPTAASSLAYNGSAQNLISAGSTTGGTLQYSTDGTTWSTDIPTGTNAGNYAVYYKVVGGNNYNDVAAQSVSPVTISQKSISGATVAVSGTPTYTGAAVEPAVTVTLDGNQLTATTDYTVSYKDNTAVGNNSATATVTGTGNYTGTASTNFSIDKATPTVNVSVSISGDAGARQAEVTVTVTGVTGGAAPTGTVTLTGDSNSLSNPPTLSNGTASYTWTGLTDGEHKIKATYNGDGNYGTADSAETTFNTSKQGQSITISPVGNKTYGDPAFTLSVSGGSGNGAVTFTSSDTAVISISGTTATILKAGGPVTITAAKAEDADYNAATATLSVTVAKKPVVFKANDKTVQQGGTMPTFDYGLVTLAQGDTIITEPTPTCTAANTNTVGTFTITFSGAILSSPDNYEVSYQPGTLTITAKPSTGGGGGGGGYTPPTYKPDITKPSGGGDTPGVTPSNPKQGDTVTVTPKPDDGHEVGGITVTDKNGKPVEVTQKPDGTYTFKQPNGKVTIDVTYRPIDRPWNNPFSDVSESDWFYEAVKFVHQRGLMNGYSDGRFGPNDNLSRAQLAQILFNKEGRPGVNYLLTFSDVAGEAWYTEAIRWATSQGIVGGYGNGMFGPNDPITREQLAVMLWRYVGSPAATDKELHFADADEISGFALEAMRWAVENGILNGYGDGRLDPQGQATRAQVAQMLKNFIEKQEEENT